jgi:hypothetical protein
MQQVEDQVSHNNHLPINQNNLLISPQISVHREARVPVNAQQAWDDHLERMKELERR